MNASGYLVKMEAYAISKTATILARARLVTKGITARMSRTSADQIHARMGLAQMVSLVIPASVMLAGMGIIVLTTKMSVHQNLAKMVQAAFIRSVTIKCMATY